MKVPLFLLKNAQEESYKTFLYFFGIPHFYAFKMKKIHPNQKFILIYMHTQLDMSVAKKCKEILLL